ncbi:MAG: type II toxin-antitoxin system HipA family toxin [Mariprofundaceae bacterium]|nr:type II toxin-antitoxin system HipA family toxin [Mariprofundaceae bacterium]
MSATRDSIGVFIYGYTEQVGTLFFARNTFTFSYAPEWVDHGFPISPLMPLEGGTFYSQGLPPIFSDVAPDRWGRRLIEKKLLRRGHKGQIQEQHYLLELSDRLRMGALRFSIDGGRTFLGEHDDIPPVSSLPKFIHLTDAMIQGEDDDYSELISNVSLGGARAKIIVKDEDGHFKLAKLPQPNDADDVEGWEFVLIQLAKKAGIDMPVATLHGDRKRHALLLARFDRNGEQRIHYMSAMTLLDRRDGESDDSSYSDLADAMSSYCDEGGLHQLYRRMVFNLICGNVDDHLRNHVFLYLDGAWRLAPAFDVTACGSYGGQHQLHVYDKGSPDTIETAIQASAHFHLDQAQAREIILEVIDAVSKWKQVAKVCKVRGGDEVGRRFGWQDAIAIVGD